VTGNRKIYLFHFLLIINHIFHTYEVYTQGYLPDKNLLITNPILFFALQLLILFILIYIAYPLLKGQKRIIPVIRIVAFIFLFYGAFLAFRNIYSEEKIVGSLTGYFFVMISLPLILWISDYLKKIKSNNST